MDWITAALPPFIGGVIGYITNDIAIRMLFRPYRPLYLGSFRLPFTPGIVPKRLPEIAGLLGTEVERQFFNADDLEILFQSEGFSHSVAECLADLGYQKRTTLCFEMEKLEASGDFGPAMRAAKETLCRDAVRALRDYDFTPMIRSAAEAVAERRGGMGKSQAQALAPLIADGLKDYLGGEGEKVVARFLDTVLVEFGDRSVQSLLSGVFPDREQAVRLLQSLYLKFMAVYVRPVVESIDVGGMITEKLRQMEPKAVETLILSVVSREFRYIVWLGGLLGAVIGTVNIFI